MTKTQDETIVLADGYYTYEDINIHLTEYRDLKAKYKAERNQMSLRELIELREDLALVQNFFCDVQPELEMWANDLKLEIETKRGEYVKREKNRKTKKDGKPQGITTAKELSKLQCVDLEEQWNANMMVSRRLKHIFSTGIPELLNALAARKRNIEDQMDYERGKRVEDEALETPPQLKVAGAVSEAETVPGSGVGFPPLPGTEPEPETETETSPPKPKPKPKPPAPVDIDADEFEDDFNPFDVDGAPTTPTPIFDEEE